MGHLATEQLFMIQTIIMISTNTIKTIKGAKKYCIFLFYIFYKFAASLAIKSTSLFNSSVECAFTQFQLILNSLFRRSNSIQSSLLRTSFLLAVFHPFFFQLCIHSVIPVFTYLESVKICTLLPFGIFLRAYIGANNSI